MGNSPVVTSGRIRTLAVCDLSLRVADGVADLAKVVAYAGAKMAALTIGASRARIPEGAAVCIRAHASQQFSGRTANR